MAFFFETVGKRIVIALDGHSACGKSTLAKALAKELGYVYVDSGAMYRAVSLFGLNNGFVSEEELDRAGLVEALGNINISFNYNRTSGKSDTFLNGINVEEEIRAMGVSKVVSKVAAVKEVRDKLVEFQQRLGENGGVVMDGRDIGTTVFPNAKLKLWITASESVRAARRYKELLEKGHEVSLQEVEENVAKRDHIDSTREESPLRRADDALTLDNSHLSKTETLNKALELANQRILEVE